MQRVSRKILQLSIFCLLGFIQVGYGQVNVDSLVNIISSPKDDTNKVLTYSALALSLFRENPEEAYKKIEDGILLAEELEYKSGKGLLLDSKARMLRAEAKFSESNQAYELAIDEYEKMGRDDLIIAAYSSMGANMRSISHRSEALQFDMKALVLAEKTNNITQKRFVTGSMARDYEQLKDFENELKYQVIALELCKQDTNCRDANMGSALNNVGSSYKNMGLYDEALDHLHQSLNLNNRIGNENTKLYNYATLADVFYLMRNYDSAQYYIDLCLENAAEQNNDLLTTYGHNDKGRLLIKLGQYDEAIKYIQRAYKRCKEVGSGYDEILELAVKNLHVAYSKKGDYKKAYDFMQEDYGFQEERYEDYIEKAAQIQIYYANEKNQAIIEQLEREEEIRKSEDEVQDIYNIMYAIGGIAMLILMFLFYRNFRNKQKANDVLKDKNKDIQKRSREIAEQKERIEKAFANVRILSEIGQEVTTHLSVEKIIETTYNRVNSLMKAEGFGIGIYDESKNRIDFPGFIEKGITYPNSYDLLENDNRLSIWSFKNQQEVIINDASLDYSKYIKRRLAPNIGESPESILYFPLVNQGKKIGVITVQSFDKNVYGDYEQDILRTLGVYIAIALENAENFKKLKATSEELEQQKEQVEQKSLTLAQQNDKLETSYENVKLLGEVGQGIISQLSVNSIVSTVYQSIHNLMDASVFWVGVYNEDTNSLDFEGAIEKGEVLEPFSIDCQDKGRLAVSCFNNEQEVLINDFLRDYVQYIPVLKQAVAGDQPSSIIYLPLKGKDGKLGVITVQSFRKYAYTEYHVNILRNLATYTTIALENALLYQNLENKVKERTYELESQKDKISKAYDNIKLLSEIGQTLTGLLSLDSLIQAIYQNVNGLMDATAFGVGIYQEHLDQIVFLGSMENGEELPTFYHDLDDTKYYSAWCYKNNKEVFTNNAKDEYVKYVPEMQPPQYGEYPNSIIYLPLRAKDRNIGVLTVQSYQMNAYSEIHLNILRNLAVYSAIALDNASAYRQIEERNSEIRQSNKKIMSSMNYAKRIQNAILPHRTSIEDSFNDAFVLFKPKDIVSGDFFWFIEKNDKQFIAAVDCTGHGVPGAFMSMIGNNLLNEIVNDLNIESPDLILNELHIRVRQALRQKETENRDGMDIALCVVEQSKGILEFAGAKNPLVYIEYNEEGIPELKTIKGDKMPIGGMQREQERIFTKHTLRLKQDNLVLANPNNESVAEGHSSQHTPKTFYIFSDGYQDQFGGKKSRKFMLKNFKRLLERLHEQPMQKQRDTLKEVIDMWMEGESQTDDILVMGFKV